MWHISNLGSFGTRVEQYADQAGYVPERGDRARDFAGWDRSGQPWRVFRAEAIRATRRAEKALEAWQRGN